MNPYQLRIQELRKGQKRPRKLLLNPYLRYFAQVRIGRVDINADVGTLDVSHDGCGKGLVHVALCVARKGPVKIEVKERHPVLGGADAQRIQCRVDVDNASQVTDALAQALRKLEGDKLSLKAITMDSRHHDNARTASTASLYTVLLHDESLAHGQRCREYRLYHVPPPLRKLSLHCDVSESQVGFQVFRERL